MIYNSDELYANTEVLRIEVQEAHGITILKLIGELDSYTSRQLISMSRGSAYGAKELLVDLDDLKYIDSAGLVALVSIWIDFRDTGRRMVLSCQNNRVHRVLEITGLLSLFELRHG